MFTLKDSWICMGDKPILSLKRGTDLFASGCGSQAVRCMPGNRVRARGRTRFVRYHVASYTVRPDEVRVLLESVGHPTGAQLILTQTGDGCLLRVEGLPWDHNRALFHIGVDSRENVLTGGELYRDTQSDGHRHVLGTGSHFIWADARKPFPVNGFYTDTGFALAVEGGALTRLSVPSFTRSDGVTRCVAVELWGTGTTIHLSLAEDMVMARDALLKRTAARQQLPDPFLPGARLVPVHGGEKAIRALAPAWEDAPEHSVPVRTLVIEDWQGMRQTLVGGMSDCTWEADRERYPQLAALLATLREQHVAYALPVLPCIDLNTELFREAAVRSHCLVGPKGHIWEDKRRENAAAWLDLTRPRTVEWVTEQLETLVDKTGARTVIARLDLPFPCEASGAGGEAATLRNGWASHWYRICREALAQREEVLVLPDLPMAPHAAGKHASGGHRAGKADNRE